MFLNFFSEIKTSVYYSLDESEPESGFLQNRNTSRRKACTLPNC